MTLKTTPIPTRNWKITTDPVSERDLKRKESKQRVDRRIYYLWFHFLKLCLELESIGHIFEKRDGGGKVIVGEGKFVKVNRDEYVGWDLDNLMSMKFNVFIRYFNGKTGDYDKDMNLSERIIRVYEKERFEQVKRNDSRSQGKSPFNKLIDKNMVRRLFLLSAKVGFQSNFNFLCFFSLSFYSNHRFFSGYLWVNSLRSFTFGLLRNPHYPFF